MKRLVVERAYHDSVTLMLASRDAEEAEGVSFAAAVAATPVNLELLRAQGFEPEEGLGPDDLVVAVEGDDAAALDRAEAAIAARLTARPASREGAGAATPRSLRSAARRDPSLNLALVSVPGRFAAFESAAALEAGVNVLCFSDGVPVEAEAVLKRRARDLGLLMMGPDCGTAILAGVGLGFANAVRSGPVGIVGASGTGTQEVCCLLDAAGVGISHAIGVGGRDLSSAVGGIMTLEGIALLAADPGTEVLCIVSKPPDPEVARAVVAAASASGKPSVLALLGAEPVTLDEVEIVATLEEAAARSAALAGGSLDLGGGAEPPFTPGAIEGLFTGGTLCAEAESIVARTATRYRFTDFGSDEFTQGRPHPMIDPTLRNEAFGRAAADGSIGAIVVDVVLGYGAHDDPAADLAGRIAAAMQRRAGSLTVAVTVCGTDGDPQGLARQMEMLAAAGAHVTRSAARAALLAVAAAAGP